MRAPTTHALMQKLAGGGARMMKSFRRMLQHEADVISKETGAGVTETMRGLSEQPFYHQTLQKLKPGGQRNPVFFMTQGSPMASPAQPQLWGDWMEMLRSQSGIKDAPVTTYKLQPRQLRQMRGQMAVDITGPGHPFQHTGNAVTFTGKVKPGLMQEVPAAQQPVGNPALKVPPSQHNLITDQDIRTQLRYIENIPGFFDQLPPDQKMLLMQKMKAHVGLPQPNLFNGSHFE